MIITLEWFESPDPYLHLFMHYIQSEPLVANKVESQLNSKTGENTKMN